MRLSSSSCQIFFPRGIFTLARIRPPLSNTNTASRHSASSKGFSIISILPPYLLVFSISIHHTAQRLHLLLQFQHCLVCPVALQSCVSHAYNTCHHRHYRHQSYAYPGQLMSKCVDVFAHTPCKRPPILYSILSVSIAVTLQTVPFGILQPVLLTITRSPILRFSVTIQRICIAKGSV